MPFPIHSNPTSEQVRDLLSNRAAAAGIQNPGLSLVDFIAYVVSEIIDATPVVLVSNLPTADPHVVGQVWSSAGVLTVSAG